MTTILLIFPKKYNLIETFLQDVCRKSKLN